ncbi:MAG TPA: serine hydrolase domain-containing protein [Terracidiphilus sp.]|nr:serine hydrolase domain-containing protein [Terracidiphilus sp.]
MRILVLAVLSAFIAPLALAQSSLPPLDAQRIASIDSFVSSELARQKIPGLAVGIYSRGNILFAKGYGLANVELNVPVAPETIFQSGSVGKQFVSAAIMMLVEEGKLSLDDSITKYFPDAPASWKPILIKNLLSHTSGLAEYESSERTGPKGPFYLRLDFTEDELVTKIEALPIEWAPGEKWAYRNTNYVLLGILIHKISGKPYAEFLAERIFKPLGMTSTRLISESDITPNRSSGYEIHDGVLKNQEWVSPTFDSTADGALYFNVLDLAKWDASLYTTQLLKQSSLDRIWTVYPLNDGKPNPAGYGFAWFIGDQNQHKRIEHGGAWQGFTCDISRYPDDNLTVVVLTNLDAGHSNPGLIAHVIAGMVVPPLMPARLAAIPDNDPAIAAKVARLLDQLAAGEDVRSQAAPQLAALMVPEMNARVKARLANLWPGGTLTLVKRNPGPDNQPVSTFRLSKGSEAVLVIYGLDAGGKIAVLGISADREYE